MHVLYHRWQVDGRKEAPAPFWIANKLDGAGSSFYTMGDRQYPELATYFEGLRAAMSSIASLIEQNSVVVQMVAFSDVAWQLPRYLERWRRRALKSSFYLHSDRSVKSAYGDGHRCRDAAGTRTSAAPPGIAEEVVLFHVKRAGRRPPTIQIVPKGKGGKEPSEYRG